MKRSFEDLFKELIKRDVRPSQQRIMVLDYLMNNQCHPTVDQIFNDLHKEIPTLSKSTVYNTLNSFIEAQLVRVITIEDHETRYDVLMKNHGHLKCDLCGKIYNFKINIDDFVINDKLNDFQINDKNVYFKGVCSRCL